MTSSQESGHVYDVNTSLLAPSNSDLPTFTADLDDATLDIIIGTMLLAARWLADGSVSDDYPARGIRQLLLMLGHHDEAKVIAESGASRHRVARLT